MSDFKLPELPSDDELGITDEDRRDLAEELPSDGSELSAEEMEALLGSSVTAKGEAAQKAGSGKGAGRAGPAGTAEGPRSRWKGPLTLAVLVAVAFVSSSRTGLPRPVPANAPDTVFSSARAMTELVDIARRPRPMGSPEHARVRELLVSRLRALGLEPEIQTATAMGQVTGVARATTVRNIVARLPGTDPTGGVLITAHYDSRELAPGAADDGAGLVTILEAIRALRAGPEVRNDVIVLLTDAEEPCLCGAQAFVDGHPWIDDVSVVLSFEMRGAGGPSIMFETNEQNGWIVRALEDFDPHPYANSMSYEVYRRMPNGTDFTEFREAGKQGLNFAALDRAWAYHQATDRAENLSESTLQHHGLRALAALRWLGDADLRSVDAPDVVYFTVPLLGLVVYGASWVTPISGLLLVLVLAGWLAARARGARLQGILIGLGLALVGASLSFGFALWLHTRVVGGYAEAGSLSGSVLYSEGWWMLAAAGGAFSIVTALHGLARRWLSAGELALGAVLVPLLLAGAAGFVAPLAAMNLQWPVAAALLGGAVVSLLGPRTTRAVGWLLTLALAVPVVAVLEPIIELVWLAMSVQLLAPIAAFMAIAFHLCLPALDTLRHPNSWWAPLTGVAVAGASFGFAELAARPSEDRPAPSTLVYAYEHGSGAALWVTDANADSVLDAEAREWAESRVGGAFSRTHDMADFALPAGPSPVTDAPLVDAPPPTVRILTDSIEGTVRRVVLSVHSNIGAEILRFEPDSAGRTRLLSINGAAIERPDSLEWAEHYGVPDSAGVVLELRMPAADPIGLHVVEHMLRPRELLGAAPFERPEGLMPDVSALSDRAVFRYSVAAYADPRHAFMPRAPTDPPAADSTPTPPDGAEQPTDSIG